jgi:hypothetical protein
MNQRKWIGIAIAAVLFGALMAVRELASGILLRSLIAGVVGVALCMGVRAFNQRVPAE